MADVSLDELIRKRGLATGTGMYSRLSNRGGTGNVRSRLQTQISSRPIATSFQKTFDARQKIGVTDARLKLGVKDAREKLAAKDARFRIKGKVQDAREMLNSRKLQVSSVDKTPKVVDAREKLSLKRSTPAVDISPAIASGSSTIKLTKTIQIPQHKTLQSGLTHSIKGMRINVVNHQTLKPPEQEDEDDEDYVEEMELSHVPAKQMKITTQNSMLKQKKTTSSSSHFDWEAPWSVMQETRSGQEVHEKCAFTPQSGSPFSVAQAQALTKVVQNDTYTLPTNPQPITIPPPLRTKPMTNMSRTLVTKEDTPAAQAIQTEPVFSPLEGTKMTVTNLHPRVTEEDIVELFCVCGALKRARLISPGIAEVVFVRKDDAVGAYKKYNNRYLDGQPMKCNLHLNGSVITSDQPILLRLSDTPATTNKEGEARRANTTSSSVPKPAAEVDPDTILKALFKSSGSSAVVQPTAFKIKL